MKKPMPGDAVKIIQSTDCLIENNSYGIIEGVVGNYEEEYLVCFNAYSIFRGTKTKYIDKPVFISASGGPAYFINPAELQATEETQRLEFWKWKDTPRKEG